MEKQNLWGTLLRIPNSLPRLANSRSRWSLRRRTVVFSWVVEDRWAVCTPGSEARNFELQRWQGAYRGSNNIEDQICGSTNSTRSPLVQLCCRAIGNLLRASQPRTHAQAADHSWRIYSSRQTPDATNTLPHADLTDRALAVSTDFEIVS